MPSEDFKKAYQVLSAKCSKKEISSIEALKFATKFKLKLAEKTKLINQLKKNQFIDHHRYAKAFVNDRFKFYSWGKLKIRHQLLQKGIEERFIDSALENIDSKEYYDLITKEALKKFEFNGSKDDFVSKQKLCNFLNLKGFEADLVFQVVELL